MSKKTTVEEKDWLIRAGFVALIFIISFAIVYVGWTGTLLIGALIGALWFLVKQQRHG